MDVFDLVARISLDSSKYEAGLKTAGANMKAIGGKMTAFGATMTKKVTLPIVALAGAAVKSFNDVKNGLNIVTQKTGATGQALQDMHQSVKTLATEIPASFEDIGTAVGEVNTRFNITGQELEDLSGQFVKFAKVNGTDVNASIDTTQKALAAFGLEASDATALLDTMTRVGQNTGVSMDTLMNGLVQNGTAFQQLGLSIDESVALMGQLDKSGANSETVMQGLRKALKNAAKDGVPLNKALGDLQDSILNGKDGMDGLATSYELFGRSGDQIYGAVKNGTIDFTNLKDAVDDAAGSLDKTFEATLTPAEKFQRTLNSLKVTGYEFGNTALTMLTPAIEKISAKAKELSEKWQNMDDGTKQMILKFVGIAAAVGPVISILGKMTISISALTSGLGGLTGTMGALAAGTAGIGTALGVFVTGIVAAGAAVATYSKIIDNQLEKEYGWDKEQKAHFKTLEDTTKAYKEVSEARDQAASDIDGEYTRIESLRNQYNELVGSNGKVTKGYEKRADFIKGELAEALGVEKDEIDKLIDKNGKLEKKIGNVIEMKKAEAYLEANKDAYTEALKNQKEAADNLIPALKDLEDKQKQEAQAKKEYVELQAQYNEQNKGNTRATAAYNEKLDDAYKKWQKLSDKVTEGKKTVKDYEEQLAESKNTIDLTEGITKAVADKDMKALKELNRAWSDGLKTRSTATKTELDEQAKTWDDYYKWAVKANKENSKEVTDDMVSATKERRKAALEEAGYTEKSWEKMQKTTSKNSKEMRKTATANTKATKDAGTRDLSSLASNAGTFFKKVSKNADTQMSKAKKSVTDGTSSMKSKFPVNVGKTLTGLLVSIFTKKEGKNVKQTKKTKPFAKAYETPYIFTDPTVYGNALVGDRGATHGGEIVYGRDKMLEDMTEAVRKVSGGDVQVNLNYNAGTDASEMVNDVARGIRRLKMAGVI